MHFFCTIPESFTMHIFFPSVHHNKKWNLLTNKVTDRPIYVTFFMGGIAALWVAESYRLMPQRGTVSGYPCRYFQVQIVLLVNLLYHQGLVKTSADYVLLHKYIFSGGYKTSRRRTYYCPPPILWSWRFIVMSKGRHIKYI